MHQHQGPDIPSVPVGNMSRASKGDPPSSQGGMTQQSAENEEAALLALLRRLGLALSPQQATSNGPQSLQNSAGDTGYGNADVHSTGEGNDDSTDINLSEDASGSDSSSITPVGSRQTPKGSPRQGGTSAADGGGIIEGNSENVAWSVGAEGHPRQSLPASQQELPQPPQPLTPSDHDGTAACLENRNGRSNQPGQLAGTASPRQDDSSPAGKLEPSGTEDAGDAEVERASRECMVDLMRREITAKEAVLLGPLLWAATGVNCLKLCYNHLKDGGAEAVSLAMRRHPSLHTMDLGFNGIADQGAASLARSLSSNRSLRTLYLSGNSIGPSGARSLAESLAANTGLTTLHLTGNCIGPDGASALADVLRSNTSLTRLFVGGAGIKARGACAMASALVTNTVLSDLYMSDNEIGDEGLEGLAHALRRNTSLRLLELCFNRITAAGAESFSKAACGARGLKSLRLDNNQMGDRGARALALVLPTLVLETLELGFNNIKAAGMAALMQGVVSSPALTSLSLSGNALDAEAAKAIQGALAQPRCALRRLSLDHTSLGRASESFIATGVLSNRRLALYTLTGFRLGAAFARLGMPQQVEQFSNDQALEQVRLYWANHGHHAVGSGGGRVSTASASSAPRSGPPPQRASTGAGAGDRHDVPTSAAAQASAPQHAEPYQLQQNAQLHTGAQAGSGDAGVAASGFGCNSGAVSAENRGVARDSDSEAASSGRRQHEQDATVPMHKQTGSGSSKTATPPPRPVWGEGPPKAPVRSAKLKSCRVAAGPNVVHNRGEGGMDGLESSGTGAAGGVGGGRKSSSRGGARGALVEALHHIAQLPFNAAELWSLHQYYFSPAPEPPVTPGEGGDSTPSPSDAHCSARTAAVGRGGATQGGRDRGGFVSTGWAEAIASVSPRKAVERDVGKQMDDCRGPCQEAATPGAGERRSRRSSSIGGEDDDEDLDSPLPPSKRYRNGSTKTRIALFPLVQDRVRMLKTKPDERGVLTLLRQLKFLQFGECDVPTSLPPEARIAMADPHTGVSGVDCGVAKAGEGLKSGWGGGSGSGSGSEPAPGVVYSGGASIFLAEHEIETLLLEEL